MNLKRHALKILGIFAATLAVYILFFQADLWLRTKNGPWTVTFGADDRRPYIKIRQDHLEIQNFTIQFTGTNVHDKGLPETVRFDDPEGKIPFGEWIYNDLTYLPGVITFQMFGHQIELLPRTLIVNRKEIPWQSNHTLELKARSLPEELKIDR